MRVPVLLLAALLAVPLAAAASDVRGEARGAGAPSLEGGGVVWTEDGVLDLSRPASHGTLRIAWSSAEGRMVNEQGTLTADTQYMGSGEEESRVAWPAGDLTRFRCGKDCVVRLRVEGGGRVGLAGNASGVPALARETEMVPQEFRTGASTVRLETYIDAAWLVAEARGDGAGYALRDGAPLAEGRVVLELWNVTATRAGHDATESVWAGVERTPRPSLVGPSMQEDVRVQRLRLTLDDAVVEAREGSGAVLAAPTLRADLDGAVVWPSAEGSVTVAGQRRELHGERLEVEGPRLALVVARDGPAPEATAALGGPDTSTAFSGEATRVRVAGQDLVRAPLAPRGVTEGAVGALGLAALLWLLARWGAWTALYSRVTGARVLTHPRRLAAFELIAARPGVHVSEMGRDLGVGRVVLQHHLRILEAHRLVTTRSVGRIKAYYPAGGSPNAEDARARAALKDATRSRVLAEVVAAPEGLTQKDLMARTGLSQRLVSYHLAHLEGLLLVQGDGARPQRFQAGPRALQAPSTTATPPRNPAAFQ